MMGNELLLVLVIGATLISIGYAIILLTKIRKAKVNHPKIKEISSYIKEGTFAFLKKEYTIILFFIIGIAILLTALGFIPALKNAEGIGYKAAICFLVGAGFSGLTGFLGMLSGIKSNGLTAEAADTGGMGKSLKAAFTGGAVVGLSVVGFGLLGLSGLFYLFYKISGSLQVAAQVVVGYGLGASLVALFARVGGGIYTKAADVGADLVGKVESGIPEDDPRNPAVIADNVGDNVGDIAGMGSDLTESYAGSIISAISIGVAGIVIGGELFTDLAAIFPLLIAGIGVLAAVISVIIIRLKEWKNPQRTLRIATYIAALIVLAGSLVLSLVFLKSVNPFFAVAAGIIVGIFIGQIAEFYTSDTSKSVKEIAHQSQTGHATNIIAGFGIGMKSTALTIIVLMLGVALAFIFNGMYGIGLAAVGMLSTVGITVSVDAYGPIADNAGGIAEMAHLDPHVREVTNKLDSVGNTTAAIGKGFCIGSATLTSLALFVAYAHAADLEILVNGELTTVINIINPLTIIGLLLGAMLPYLFSSLTINSVGKAANKMIEEVRRQFSDDPGIMLGTSKPDYAKCVDISTSAALREMILPGLIAVLSPIAIGFLFGAEALGGLLVGSLASASMLAVFMANAGGAWDNAKKLIESGLYGGKNSEAHKAAVTGDTVGDPFKDTAGPAMDILIKLMSIISLIIAPVLIEVTPLFLSLFQ
ncbi:MAG: sodium-translocating pyrophosphatase [Bacilli bacterium]|jgi:K(+)-stimulated pyrophosphate-energized sodium pump|nr:sodium-translocating pyrophosphatase [Bacilli bacterium]MDD2681919.1 sodium-translocating pyrophosphatase [Bacilli bacterium]MDD3121637.1 sodium-translocating pyrophosphatase [Bacilli bacterium]MDD4063714.1 sodium-translocating pyrophosphatase [Bacilli bacterium]MDD4482415.1 sodium-translocating pyrophosphatase [Bacilli bacterium]